MYDNEYIPMEEERIVEDLEIQDEVNDTFFDILEGIVYLIKDDSDDEDSDDEEED